MSRRMPPATLLAEWVRPLTVEFIGPFALVFAGAGAIIADGDLVAVALAHGLAIGLFVMAAGHISGGLYNPALTVGFVATGRLTPQKGAAYAAVQVLGGLAAAGLLAVAFDKDLWDPVNLGAPQIASPFSTGQAFLLEAVMTFFLMFVVFGVAVDKRSPKEIAGLAIGLTITMDIFLGGAATGAAMNPARAFGPALVANAWDDQWLYWAAPAAGAIVAALLYEYVIMGKGVGRQDKAA